MRGLYPLCDVDTLERVGLSPLAYVDALLAASVRPALLQLRAKRWSRERVRQLALPMAERAARAGVQLVVNDDAELARECGAWLHVGQDDAAAADVRRSGVRGYGRSTHSLAQLAAALEEGADYVAYGPVFATTSKVNPEPCVGAAGLAEAHGIVAGRRPLCAIGGIGEDCVQQIAAHAELIAVIGALVHPDVSEVTRRADRLATLIEAAR